MAIRSHRQDGILTLTFDTEGSSVNIFNHEAAAEVEEAVKNVDPSVTRAIVFRSAKPGSFINGVGLMLANAVHSAEDAIALTESTWRAYQAVRDCKVPTVAAIQGNCYGCGVEFTLNCDYRVSSDTYDTHFYMTEISEYLFIPCFGGTQNIPPLVGLDKAMDFVLWGERWSAEAARAAGLINEVFGYQEFDAKLEDFLRRTVLARKGVKPQAKRRPPMAVPQVRAVIAKTAERIEKLPPAYQNVYRGCASLMARACRREEALPRHYRGELLKSADSVMAPPSKAALSFFFVRQIAQGVCLRGEEPLSQNCRLRFPVSSGALTPLRNELAERKLAGVTVETRGATERADGVPTFTFSAPGDARAARAGEIVTELVLTEPLDAVCILYAPLYKSGSRFFELAAPELTGEIRALYRYLARVGYPAIVSTPKDGLAFNRWLGAYFAPCVAHCLSGGNPADVAATLRLFGVARRPAKLIESFAAQRPQLAAFVLPHLSAEHASLGAASVTQALTALGRDSYESGSPSETLLDALTLSLLAEARHQLGAKVLAHPTLVDLIARELLDFPLQHKSLCNYLKKDRIAAVLARAGAVRPWLSAATLDTAAEFTASGREFYL